MKLQHQKTSEYLIKKGDENEGIVKYGNDFINCRNINFKQYYYLQRIVKITIKNL